MENSGCVFGKQTMAATERSESLKPPSPTRLQRRAPAALQLDRSAQNPFSPSTTIMGTTIPLLSPLYVSPSVSSSSLLDGEEFTFLVDGNNGPEKKGSLALPDGHGGWQHPAMSDHHAEQMALLTMFQTKFVLVNDS